MATKIPTTELKVGMFVADLDRPWVDTPFLLQGFLIVSDDQIIALRDHCDFVIVDRARSTGAECEANPESQPSTIAPASARRVTTSPAKAAEAASPGADAASATTIARTQSAPAGTRPVFRLEDIAARRAAPARPSDGANDIEYPGLLGRLLSGIK